MATVASAAVTSLSDAQLARGLRLCGVEFGPITETTRDVYRRKLSRLISSGALNAEVLVEDDKSVTAGAHGVTRTRAASRKTSAEKDKNNEGAKNQQEKPKLESALAKKTGRKKSKNQRVTWSDMSGSSLDEEDLVEELNMRNTGKDKEQRKNESHKSLSQTSKSSKEQSEKEESIKPRPASSNRKTHVIEKEIIVREMNTSNAKRGNANNSAIRKKQHTEHDDDDDDVNDSADDDRSDDDDDNHNDDNTYDNIIDNSLKEKLNRVSIQDRFSNSTPKSATRSSDGNGNKFSDISPGPSEVSCDDGYYGSSTSVRSGNKIYSGGSEEQVRNESFSHYARSARNGNDDDDYEGDDDDNYNSADLYDAPLTRPSLHSGSEYRPPIYTSSDRYETRSIQLLKDEPRTISQAGQLSACLDLLQIRSDIKKKGKNYDREDNVQSQPAELPDRCYGEDDFNDDYTRSDKLSKEHERMRKNDSEKIEQYTAKDVGRKLTESKEDTHYDERGIYDLVQPGFEDLDDDDYSLQKSSKANQRFEGDMKKGKLFDSMDDRYVRNEGRGDVRVHSVQYAEKRNDLKDDMGYMQNNMGEDIRSLPKARKNIKSDEKYAPEFTREKNVPGFTQKKHREKKYYVDDEDYGGKSEVKTDDDSSMMWIIVMIIIIVVVLIAMLY